MTSRKHESGDKTPPQRFPAITSMMQTKTFLWRGRIGALSPRTSAPGKCGLLWRTLAGWIVIAVVCAMFFFVLFRTAWVCDDAYITFRTVDNFVHGHGMRWNVAERVQSFTHPLWFFLLSASYYFTREIYYTSLVLSMSITMLTVGLFIWTSRHNVMKAVTLLTGLLFSRAFMDYSTSGLENPLSHLLLVIFLLIYAHPRQEDKRLFLLAFVSSLGMLNRLDMGLIYLPCLAAALISSRRKRAAVIIALGMSPVLLWMLFSLVYYGFLFPNTAYAKLGADIPRLDLMAQGLRYFQNSLTRDPLTLTVTLAAIPAIFIFGQRRLMAPALGVTLYLLYIIRIGGDFMSGRYFTAPLLVAMVLLLLTPIRITAPSAMGLVLTFAIVGCITPHPTISSGGQSSVPLDAVLDPYLIADERAYYYRHTGLMAHEKRWGGLTHPAANRGRAYRSRERFQVVQYDTTGFFGYYAGPFTHIIDEYAISDPLLARLPMKYAPMWRVGHFRREVPEGYMETLMSGENVLADPALSAYYEELSMITRAPILSWKRLKTILRFHGGRANRLIDSDRYRFPNLQQTNFAALSRHVNADDAMESVPFSSGGLEISWDTPRSEGQLHLDIDGGPYYVLFMANVSILAVAPRMPASVFDFEGFQPEFNVVEVPAKAQRNGYNAIRIMPVSSTEEYQLNHVALSAE